MRKLIGRVKCVLGMHHRSRGQAKLVGEVYRSKCQYCRIPMRQTGRLDWEVDRGQPYDAKAGRFFDVE